MNKIQGIFAIAAVLAPLAIAVPVHAAPPPADLVVNGDFTSTNPKFFSSDYTMHSYPTSVGSRANGTGPGFFELGPDPSLDNSSWVGGDDGTTFMLVDGSTAGSATAGATAALNGTSRVWFETLNVIGGKTYKISALAESFEDKNAADLIFTIGGKHGTQIGSDFQLGPVSNGWTNMNATWTAATTGTISFAIVDRQTANCGYVFFLDEISFMPVPEASSVVTFALLFIGGLLVLRKRNHTQTIA